MELELWSEYVSTRDFQKISNYIRKEYDLFKSYYENLNQNVKNQLENNPHPNHLIEQAINVQHEYEINDVLRSLLQDYFKNILSSNDKESHLKNKDVWIHMNELLDCLNSERVFYFDMSGKDHFNFKLFYQEINSASLDQISKIVKDKLSNERLNFL